MPGADASRERPKPLLSVARLCDETNHAVFESTGGYVEHLLTGEKVHFRRDGNIYNLEVETVPTPGLARPGMIHDRHDLAPVSPIGMEEEVHEEECDKGGTGKRERERGRRQVTTRSWRWRWSSRRRTRKTRSP